MNTSNNYQHTTDSSTDDSNANRWAPLCYPSASIFSSPTSDGGSGSCAAHPSSSSGGGSGIHHERCVDQFFPLHRDVLLAAMRELLIIDGRIDARTMNIVVPAVSSQTRNMSERNKRPRSASNIADEAASSAILPTPSDDEEEGTCATASTSKKQRIQNSSVDSIEDLQKQILEKACSTTSTHRPHVVPIIADRDEFDYSRFDSAEALVEYVVNQATSFVTKGSAEQTTLLPSSIDEQTVATTSKRKVSNVDMETNDNNDDDVFPSCIVSLVRSNTMVFQTFSSGVPSTLTKLQKCLPHNTLTEREKSIFHSTQSPQVTTMTELLPTSTDNFEKINDVLIEFLRFPQRQRQRQHGNANKSLFVLPQLLEASVTDEGCLREFAHNMVVSMVNSIPGNDFDIPLRVFLGYKSTKTPSKERILDMVSDVLFDVSHAMHAWVHTEKDLLRKHQTSTMPSKDLEEQIKNALFDEGGRALAKIGGFEESSLLPLSLGIRRCRQTRTPWVEYAASAGKSVFSLHVSKAKSTNVRKRQSDIIGNAEVFETGRKRRGRRGRTIYSHRINGK